MTNGVRTPQDSDGGGPTVVQNPLRQTHEAALGNNRALMEMDFSWDCREGDFFIDVSHETEDIAVGSNECSTSGYIIVTPGPIRGLQLTFDGEYTYWAPSAGFLISLTMIVNKVGISSLYYVHRRSGPAVLGPPADTLTGGTSLFLEADGSSYRIEFRMRSDTYQGGTDIIATGNGDIAIQLEAVGFAQGDANCDGCVNGADIDGFVLGLADPTAYAEEYASCSLDYLDMDGDGSPTMADVTGFVQTLLGD